MPGLAVGAVVEAASVDGDDLNQSVLPDLGEVQWSPAHFLAIDTTLTIKSDCVTC